MRANYNRQTKRIPCLEVVLELNQKFGEGYQARMILDGVCGNILDSAPFTLYEVVGGVSAALEEINKISGSDYKLHQVLRITDEALRANRGRDFASAQMLRDIENGSGEFTVPLHPIPDSRRTIVDGEEDIALSGRGAILFAFFAWRDDKMPKARESLIRYCQYLALHGRNGNATTIFEELESKGKDDGSNWIKATYGKHVSDDADLIHYVFVNRL